MTSGNLERISYDNVEKYFSLILNNKTDYHFMVTLNPKVIGHIALIKRKNSWFESQIIIGEGQYRNKGYGTQAISQLIKRAAKLGIHKAYLEVRPDNYNAIRVYERCGFKKAKIKKYKNNKYLSEVIRMELV